MFFLFNLDLTSIQDLILQNNLLAALVVLVGGWFLAAFLPKLLYTLDQKTDKIDLSETTHAVLRKLLSFFIWLITIVLLIFISGINQFFASVVSSGNIEAKLLQLLIIWVVAYVFVKHVSSSFKKFDDYVKQIDFSEHAHQLLKKAINYGVYTIAIIISLQILEWTSVFTALLASAGVAGIVIGFAAKDVFSNLLSGIFLVFDRPFKINDVIEVKGAGLMGTVKEISLRITEITTFDNLKVTIPNSLLSTNAIINYSRYGDRRIDFTIGVEHGADVEKVGGFITAALSRDEALVPNKPPYFNVAFSDTGINFTIFAWINTKAKGGFIEIKNRLMETTYNVLKKNKIRTPLQRVEYVKKGKN
ncbi:MAG: mechanosensitive ion channel family protein [Candidatus Micrarchaeota archaeon]